MDNQQLMQTSSEQFNRRWRIFATALGFVLFGLGGLIVLSILWFSLLRLLIWNRNRRNIVAQQSICISFKCFLWVIKSLKVIDYKFTGIEKLKQDKSCLVVANHPSLLDFVLLASVMPRCDCMVKESLLKNVFVRGIIKAAGYVPNTKASQMLPYCQQILQDQGCILIFPEGTRSIPKTPLTLQRGAANIALRCNADIRLVHIECNPPLLIKNQKWYDVPSSKPFFNITIGEKIIISEFVDDNITIAARQLTKHLTTKLNKICE